MANSKSGAPDGAHFGGNILKLEFLTLLKLAFQVRADCIN